MAPVIRLCGSFPRLPWVRGFSPNAFPMDGRAGYGFPLLPRYFPCNSCRPHDGTASPASRTWSRGPSRRVAGEGARLHLRLSRNRVVVRRLPPRPRSNDHDGDGGESQCSQYRQQREASAPAGHHALHLYVAHDPPCPGGAVVASQSQVPVSQLVAPTHCIDLDAMVAPPSKLVRTCARQPPFPPP